MLDEKKDYNKEQFQLDLIEYLDDFLSKHNNSGVAILIPYIKKYLLFSDRDSCYLEKVKDRLKGLDYDSDSFFINLDIIAMGMDHQKDNFENFEKIVDDVIGLVLKCNNFDYYIDNVRPIINLILMDNLYKDDKNIRKYLIAILSNLNDWAMCNKFINCFNLCEDKISPMEDGFYGLLEKESKIYFPSKAIYIADNYFYVLDKLLDEKNPYFRKYILSKFNSLSSYLFEKLDFQGLDDSFKLFVDSVFDSDSYNEVKSKLNNMCLSCDYLYTYHSLCSYVTKEIGLSNALNFYNRDFKDSYCGKVLAYPKNAMNIFEKPKRIIDRMKYLYRRIDDSFSYDFIDKIYDEASDIDKIDESIREEIRKSKTFLGRVKRKIKKKI